MSAGHKQYTAFSPLHLCVIYNLFRENGIKDCMQYDIIALLFYLF